MNKSFSFSYPKDARRALFDLKTKPPDMWEKKGEAMVLDLFQFVSTHVPAYKTFLFANGIDPRKIKSIADFKKLPIINKETYLRRASYTDLFPEADVTKATTLSATSGSTGEPFYFPRNDEQDKQYEFVAELFLKNQFEIDKYRTLGVIGFGMGIWIGGIFTYKNFNEISMKGYSFSLAPIGPNIALFLKTVKKFAPLYEQIVLMGYPPFIKDVIDAGKEYGIDWKKYRVRVLTAAEGFSEQFRAYIGRKANLKNPAVDTINIYGTVELGTMAHETAFANFIRKIAVENPKVFATIFPKANRTPTLAQYHPYLVYFEEIEDEIIGTGYGSLIPLIRYRFPDIGGVVTFSDMVKKVQSAGVDIMKEAKKAGINKYILKLPFVYVYERKDFAVILRGVNIYPEEIKEGLQHQSLEQYVTGKFTMVKRDDAKMNEYLELNLELKKGVHSSSALEEKISRIIVETLRRRNSEYDDQYRSRPDMVRPRIKLWIYQHDTYFEAGTKQKWVLKSIHEK